MAEKFPKLVKNINQWIQELQQTPDKKNIKKTIVRHLILKRLKIKDREKSWKHPEGETTPGTEEQRMTADFLSETMQGREQWSNLFKLLKEKENAQQIVHQ